MNHREDPQETWGSDFERELLGSARADAPEGRARSKLLLSLGVAGALTTVTEGAVAAGTAATVAKGGALLALKWVTVAVVAAGALAIAATAVRRSSVPAVALSPTGSKSDVGFPRAATERTIEEPLAPMPSALRAPKVALAEPAGAALPGPARLAVANAVESAMEKRGALIAPRVSVAAATISPPAKDAREVGAANPADTIPTGVASAPSAVPTAAETSTTQSTVATLAAETAAIDAVRSALRQQRTTDALTMLEAYAQRFPQGTFEPEATALRVEALLPSDRAAAERLGQSFLATHPTSPLAVRIRELLNR